jgi:hypothetical protein
MKSLGGKMETEYVAAASMSINKKNQSPHWTETLHNRSSVTDDGPMSPIPLYVCGHPGNNSVLIP